MIIYFLIFLFIGLILIQSIQPQIIEGVGDFEINKVKAEMDMLDSEHNDIESKRLKTAEDNIKKLESTQKELKEECSAYI